MPVKSNSLTHFTEEIDTLRSILENGFLPSYCTEDFSYIFESTPLIPSAPSIPMVCFCDIPIHLINDHIERYGKYGLGLQKSWGIKKHLNPVSYIIAESSYTNSLIMYAQFFMKALDILVGSISSKEKIAYLKGFALILSYTKPCIIKVDGEDFDASQENEWRYIPFDFTSTQIFPFDLEEPIAKAAGEKRFLKDYPLQFEPDDIKYIFVKEESDRLHVVNMIKELKSSKYTNDQLAILTSKILSSEQIIYDM